MTFEALNPTLIFKEPNKYVKGKVHPQNKFVSIEAE